MNEFNFEKRVSELNFYINCLKKLNDIVLLTPYKNPYGFYMKEIFDNIDKELSSDTFIIILKSNAFMMMYNLIEATIKQTVFDIYDSINADSLTYEELNSKYKELFNNYQFKSNKGKEISNRTRLIETSNSLISDILSKKSVEFKKTKFHLSGNADMPQIIKIFNKHDIKIKDNNSFIPFSIIKDSRNILAHGSETFSSVGKKYTFSDIEDYSVTVIDFLNYIIEETKKYVHYKKYKK